MIEPVRHEAHRSRPGCLLWSPPASEHELARSLGLVDCDRATHLDLIAGGKAEAERQGMTVTVMHSRCQAVVQALSVLGRANTSESRAAAYLWLWQRRGERG